MKSFGALLREYMTRTGISDSELARALGVRRQTIFRWKEGQTEHPRYRSDVTKIAEKLRLTPDERDALLLAGGYPPESMRVRGNGMPLPTIAATQSPLAPDESQVLQKTRADSWRRGLWRWFRIMGGMVAVGLIITGILFLVRGKSTTGVYVSASNYPAANANETLIVVGRITGDTDGDLTARVLAALEREIQAARLHKTRVAAWGEEIKEGETVKKRSNAAVVIWGMRQGEKLSARVSLANAIIIVDEMFQRRIIGRPSEIEMTLDLSSATDLRAFALFVLTQIYLDGNDVESAHANLLQALALEPTESDARRMFDWYADLVGQLVEVRP